MFRLIARSIVVAGSLLLPALADSYRPPDLEKEIFDVKKVELDKFDRSGAVSSLVSVARDFDEEDEVDFELRAHALAIAHRLDKENDNVESTLAQLKENGETIGEASDKERVARRLFSAIRSLTRKKDNDDNKTCAAYIADIALRLDPEGEYAGKLEEQKEELSGDGHKADWKGMLGRPIHRSRNPWDDEEEVFEKKEVTMPGGDGERFAQAQSRINALVVRQLGNGNHAGAASTVNATALREEDVEGLLFTFNQDVGPMMGGCLEEVIKFLRIRYDADPDKIPSGYRIELAFQDKYVPKDGPSAATVFTLLLDSLFSGEEIDPEFAATGDMTADGMVQRIGGTSAKIRGATKRGCKIVGIPLDNGKEIGDVLLIDGIDPILDIQVFTMKDFDEAYELSRLKKSSKVKDTLDLFEQVAEVIREQGEEVLANQAVQKKLEEIIDRMPNHLSASLLLQKGRDENPKKLTIGGTLNQIEIATSGTFRQVARAVFNSNFSNDEEEEEDEDAFEFDKETRDDARASVEEIKKMKSFMDPRIKKYLNSVTDLLESVADRGDESPKKYGAKLKEQFEAIQNTYRKMLEDPEIMEDMGM
ncbi:MAG: hypothetical protein MUF31_13210 [Akkermansiaceae bacterium]|jgi:hypothetical protein|nr:hypothetical protein [Akkermansiaceae bacterium]